MRARLPALLVVAALTGLAACQDLVPDAATPVAPAGSKAGIARRSPTATPPPAWARFELPPSVRVLDLDLRTPARRAIDPDAYVCYASTPVRDWFQKRAEHFFRAEPAVAEVLYDFPYAEWIVLLDAILSPTPAAPQYFGYRGEYTRVVQKAERETKRFWDIPSPHIETVGMHGSMLLDTARVAGIYEMVFYDPAELPWSPEEFARRIREAVLESRVLNGGNHPLFSANAMALGAAYGDPSDRIVLGDGILDAYAQIGYGDVAPQAIYAHEFAHHVQFANGYFEDPYATVDDEAEATRYTEMMADAMAAYYLTHKRGQAMNRKRVEQFLQIFFQLGDCSFNSPGHHGTPNQRLAAARFGFDVADQAQKQGHILTSDQFHALFVKQYPKLIAPDRP
jgi:hypothetical protein